MAGNRTQVNCLEGSYAYHYTTIATNPLEFGSQNGINVGTLTLSVSSDNSLRQSTLQWSK